MRPILSGQPGAYGVNQGLFVNASPLTLISTPWVSSAPVLLTNQLFWLFHWWKTTGTMSALLAVLKLLFQGEVIGRNIMIVKIAITINGRSATQRRIPNLILPTVLPPAHMDLVRSGRHFIAEYRSDSVWRSVDRMSVTACSAAVECVFIATGCPMLSTSFRVGRAHMNEFLPFYQKRLLGTSSGIGEVSINISGVQPHRTQAYFQFEPRAPCPGG